ncbi:Type II secretory pathway, pullulanase PulA [Gemmobacter aquarius]|uniref:Type II secretory pathway, pullulanase PulA n=1 Tax=Paragemmobacter aquarius TaxID=2169400 RepID=A0A2S0UPM8_9RHOB|nr:sulfotransferase family 2 domain-containing protein [Gemmobacter aquarius]AWB49766.1 Type II secretory pathway, pullulanase PulA [Gemmobacter aquarius]
MIYSPSRRFVFIHIPKTGGTALALALEARARADDVLVGDTPKAMQRRGRQKALRVAGRLWKHSTLADLEGLLPPHDGLFTLTLVRNPWDRMVSYYHWLRGQSFAHPAVGLAKTHDFSGFLNHPLTRTSISLWPYTAYMRDAAGVEHCSLYARLERLDEDIAPFEAHLGFRLGTVARANASARPADWRPAYSDADAALVADLCAVDIARFGYAFDGLA